MTKQMWKRRRRHRTNQKVGITINLYNDPRINLSNKKKKKKKK